MPFQPGNDPNRYAKGRKPGAKNRVTSETETLLVSALNDNHELFLKEFRTLKGRGFVDAYLKLAQIILPRISEVSLNNMDILRDFILSDDKSQREKIGEILASDEGTI